MLTKGLIAELDNEARTTRRLLERVPADKLAWKPHEKSMSLGQLSGHIASLPGFIRQAMSVSEFDFAAPRPANPPMESAAALLAQFDKGTSEMRAALESMDDAGALAPWTAKHTGKTLMQMPKAGLVRGLLMNHGYHHRGQLSVYLRLLDIPVPSIYGPTADENPFA